MTAEALVVVTDELTRRTLAHWRTVLDRVAGTGPGRLVMDLAQAPTIDADGIDLLLGMHRRLMADGGELVLRQPNAKVCRLIGLARLNGVLTIEAAPARCGDAASGALR